MGWTTCRDWTRSSLIRDRIEGETSERTGTIRTCIAHCFKGAPWKGTLWTVWELTKVDGTKQRYIGCDLLQYYSWDKSWGYKDMEAGMGPCQSNCPLSYLLMGPFDYDYEKGTFFNWVGRVLYNSRRKESPLYKKVEKMFPGAIAAFLEDEEKWRNFVPKKMVTPEVFFQDILPK